MINFNKVSKTFNGKKALDRISYKARKGEVIVFLGPNGAGKTTTMRLLVGYLRPTSGKVMIGNLNPIIDRVDVLEKIGYLAENNPLPLDLKVVEYLQFFAQIKKEKNWRKRANEVGLEDVLSSKIEELSRGYKQRVGLAVALFGNPEIIILDEPTSGLDPLEQETIRKLIKNFAKKKTVIFSTHILSEAEKIATRIIIINKGKIVYDGKKPKTEKLLEKLFKKKVAER